MTRRSSSRRRPPTKAGASRRHAAALAAALLAAGCGAAPPVVEVPLFDDEHVADILTEGRRLEPPPSLAGNRFVQGWWPWKERRTLRLVAFNDPARLSFVSLEPRPRTLVLAGARPLQGEVSEIEVRLDGRVVGRVPIDGAEVTIPLPAPAGIGRRIVDLALPPGAQLAVDGAALREALPAGRAGLRGDELVQTGDSLVDMVRRLDGAATLVGRFVPPAPAAAGQSFALLVEREGSVPVEVWRWRPGVLARLAGERELEVPLGDAAGLVRLRFLARGSGPEARWVGLRLRVPPPEPPAAMPDPPPAPRLVVIYVMDALRADHVGHLGGVAGGTPTLDRLAAEGALFTRHHALAPSTLPSVKSLFTGRVFLDDGMRALPRKGPGPTSLAERFAAAGYATGLFTGNGYVFHQAQRGFGHAEESVLYTAYEPAGFNDNAERIHAAALRWLDGLPAGQPALLYLHTVHPHNPYQPPPQLAERFAGGIPSRLPGDTETLLAVKRGELAIEEPDRARIRALYQGGLTYNDDELGAFLAALAERHPAPELLAVVTSDHGEELFDHGGLLHGYTLYREQLEVPLTVWWPGRLAPRRIDVATDHVELHATLRRLVDREVTEDADPSLWPLLLGETGGARFRPRFAAASGVPGGIFGVRDERYKLIWAPRVGAGWGQGEGLGRGRDAECFFDLEADPDERRNLAGEDSLPAAWLRSLLLAWIERHRAAPSTAPPVIDEAARRNLEALGYVD